MKIQIHFRAEQLVQALDMSAMLPSALDIRCLDDPSYTHTTNSIESTGFITLNIYSKDDSPIYQKAKK